MHYFVIFEVFMKTKHLYTLCLLSLFLSTSASYSAKIDELLPTERNTIQIFDKASPKVVYVHRMATVRNRANQQFNVPAGAGSGIIWDNKGHIVTNFHVINGADKLAVSIGKMTFPAKVIGTEPRKDIAVLALSSPEALKLLTSFKPFEVAHSQDLIVGQKTIAIGNPFGLDHSLTTGVISALGRQVPGAGGVTIHGMIQTDASINPGNSGGPLLDSAGRLIGLNTAIYSQTGASAGIGFAVPADEMARLVDSIVKEGRVALAGIGIQRIEPTIAAQLGVKKGILIGEVMPKTPAASAGLRGTFRNNWGQISLGDIIVALNGHPVENYDVLYNLLSTIKIGEPVVVTIVRDDRRINHTMKTINIAALS